MTDTRPDRKTSLGQKLAEARQILYDAVAGLEGDDWHIQVQADGDQWTVLQMLRHLQDAETGLTGQAKRIVAGEQTVPSEFNIDTWNTRVQQKTAEAEMSAEDALKNLAQSRKDLLAFLETLEEEDWAKSGLQPGLQQELSLYKFIAVIAGHEAIHAQEIAEAVRAAKG